MVRDLPDKRLDRVAKCQTIARNASTRLPHQPIVVRVDKLAFGQRLQKRRYDLAQRVGGAMGLPGHGANSSDLTSCRADVARPVRPRS